MKRMERIIMSTSDGGIWICVSVETTSTAHRLLPAVTVLLQHYPPIMTV